MNDLWKYDISTNRWTWVKGSAWSRTPVYGTKGVPSPSNDPGSLAELHTWVDQSGNFWFFGGLSEKNASGTSVFQPTNTLWKFEPATGNWTWMAGGNDVRQGATYGTKGIASLAINA